jgi:hypothetical protein
MSILNELEKYENGNIKKELTQMGAEIIDDKVKLYRGADAPKNTIKKLRYNDYLSIVKYGNDSVGNAGASSYGKNIVDFLISIEDIKITNGEIQYIGKSQSLKGGNKYPFQIYKAYNDVYGSNYTAEEIDKQDNVKSVASMGMSGGRDEFDELMKKYKE